MAKKMAVRNRNNSTKRAKSNYSFSRFIKPAVKVISIIALVSILGLAVVFFPKSWSSFLPVENIAFAGEVKYVKEQQVINLLKEKKSSSMLFIDLLEIRSAVLDLDWVKNVEVRKEWPNTLVFSFEEFEPIAKINNGFLIETGEVIKTNNELSYDDIIVVDISEGNSLVAGQLVELATNLLAIQQQLAMFQLEVRLFSIDERNSWSIDIEDKFLLKVGRKQQSERVERFLQIYAAIENKKQLESIDLRYNNGLAVLFKNESKEPKQNG